MAPPPPKMKTANQATVTGADQKDRSLTVMIPRAKYQSQQQQSQLGPQIQPLHHHHHHHHHESKQEVSGVNLLIKTKDWRINLFINLI